MVTIISAPAQARKSFLEGMMPFLYDRGDENIPPPSETLQAPFAYDPAKPVQKEVGLPQNAIPLNQPHRGQDDISRWVVTAVSEALTFSEKEYRPKIEEAAEQFFIPAAARQYQSFLRDNKILGVLEGRRYRVQSFTQGRPALLNEGALQGQYRWLYEVPVMVSYMDRLNFDYRENSPINQKYTLMVQVGRQKGGGFDGEGIAIESWALKSQ